MIVADVGKELSRLFVRSVSDFSSILEEMAFSKKSFDAIFSLTELRRRRESAVGQYSVLTTSLPASRHCRTGSLQVSSRDKSTGYWLTGLTDLLSAYHSDPSQFLSSENAK